MPKENDEGIKLPSLDELFSSQKERNDAKLKKIEEIPLSEIDPFPDHPYKVKDDEDMEALIESIRVQGIITPCTVRMKKKEGRYELISGHRRMRACEILGIPTLRCEVMELTKEEATILMVESNFQRTQILPSEKAFAYKMRMQAMRQHILRLRQRGMPVADAYAGMKSKEILEAAQGGGPVVHLEKTRDIIGAESGESGRQIQRYIRLTELIPELLDMVDEGKIAFRPAVELSYLEQWQHTVLECIEMEQCTPSLSQAMRMKKMFQEGTLTKEAIHGIMLEEKANQKERISFRADRFAPLFPKNLPAYRREDYVVAALEHYGKYLARKDRDQER
ncbi:MAG: ParB/RepB/Spo0J family partition protein [Oscillospiraceae bacterium]|nr:ParB/RepB/Spo0J family partition protein [Oscillospiraceae bacterium]